MTPLRIFTFLCLLCLVSSSLSLDTDSLSSDLSDVSDFEDDSSEDDSDDWSISPDVSQSVQGKLSFVIEEGASGFDVFIIVKNLSGKKSYIKVVTSTDNNLWIKRNFSPGDEVKISGRVRRNTIRIHDSSQIKNIRPSSALAFQSQQSIGQQRVADSETSYQGEKLIRLAVFAVSFNDVIDSQRLDNVYEMIMETPQNTDPLGRDKGNVKDLIEESSMGKTTIQLSREHIFGTQTRLKISVDIKPIYQEDPSGLFRVLDQYLSEKYSDVYKSVDICIVFGPIVGKSAGLSSWGSYGVQSGLIFMPRIGFSANYGTIFHEIGHVLGLAHSPQDVNQDGHADGNDQYGDTSSPMANHDRVPFVGGHRDQLGWFPSQYLKVIEIDSIPVDGIKLTLADINKKSSSWEKYPALIRIQAKLNDEIKLIYLEYNRATTGYAKKIQSFYDKSCIHVRMLGNSGKPGPQNFLFWMGRLVDPKRATIIPSMTELKQHELTLDNIRLKIEKPKENASSHTISFVVRRID